MVVGISGGAERDRTDNFLNAIPANDAMACGCMHLGYFVLRRPARERAYIADEAIKARAEKMQEMGSRYAAGGRSRGG